MNHLGQVKSKGEIKSTIILPKEIKSAKPGCGSCTKVSFEGNALNITYKALDSKGLVAKSVTVTYTDNTTEKIKFTVNVI